MIPDRHLARHVPSQREVTLPSLRAERRYVKVQQRLQCRLDRSARRRDRRRRVTVGAAERLGDDLVHDPQVEQVLRREAQRFGGGARLVRVAPENARAALGRLEAAVAEVAALTRAQGKEPVAGEPAI